LARKRNLPAEPRVPLRELLRRFLDSIPALMTLVIIMGGILSGVFTPTEASVIAAIYSFILGFFIYRELKLKDIPRIMVKTAVTTGIVVFCIASASSFGWIVAAERIPAKIAEAILAFSTNKYVILTLFNFLMLFLGTFLDVTPIIIIVVPIIFPIALKLGISPIHFGLMTIVNMAIGQCTPPVGVSLFVATGIANVSLGEILGTYVKYLLAMIIVLFIISFIPPLVTFIPSLVMGIK